METALFSPEVAYSWSERMESAEWIAVWQGSILGIASSPYACRAMAIALGEQLLSSFREEEVEIIEREEFGESSALCEGLYSVLLLEALLLPKGSWDPVAHLILRDTHSSLEIRIRAVCLWLLLSHHFGFGVPTCLCSQPSVLTMTWEEKTVSYRFDVKEQVVNCHYAHSRLDGGELQLTENVEWYCDWSEIERIIQIRRGGDTSWTHTKREVPES